MPDPMLRITEPGLNNVVNIFRLIEPNLLRALPAVFSLVQVHAVLSEQPFRNALDQAIDLALGEAA